MVLHNLAVINFCEMRAHNEKVREAKENEKTEAFFSGIDETIDKQEKAEADRKMYEKRVAEEVRRDENERA